MFSAMPLRRSQRPIARNLNGAGGNAPVGVAPGWKSVGSTPSGTTSIRSASNPLATNTRLPQAVAVQIRSARASGSYQSSGSRVDSHTV